MIELKNVSFSYSGSKVLGNINLRLEKGRFYGIIGPNGCGKTTLLKLIAGQLAPPEGKIELDGRDYSKIKRRDFARSVAMLPQERPCADMSVRELAECGRYPYSGLSVRLSPSDNDAVRFALELTDTAALADKRLRELSGGERQRAYLAMLFSQSTPYVLLDEPITYLDIGTQLSVMGLLKNTAAQGRCVVAVLHDLPLALKMCDSIIVLSGGSIKALGSSEDILQSGCISEVFGVDCREILFGDEKEYFIKQK